MLQLPIWNLGNPVTLRKMSWTNAGGTRKKSVLGEAQTTAIVSRMSADRQVLYGVEEGVMLRTAYFSADPGVRVDDRIIWQGRTLVVLAPADDQAGQGAIYAVDCKEIRSGS